MSKILFFLLFAVIKINFSTAQESVEGKKLINLGYESYTKNNYNEATNYFQKAIIVSFGEKDSTTAFSAYKLMFDLFASQAKHYLTLNYIPEIKKFENAKNYGIVGVYNSIGVAYQYNGQLDLAFFYFEKAVKIINKYKKIDDGILFDLGQNHVNLANLFDQTGEVKKAELHYQRSIIVL